MPKRINNIAPKIYDIDNIKFADKQARRGKKKRYGIIKHDRHRDSENEQLSETLRTDKYQVSKYRIQKILEPAGNKMKERVLKKLPYFPDRIAQWAMMAQLVPIWDKLFVSSTYSCIIGRGIHKCAADLRNALDKDPINTKYCLKLDIKKCYDNINHVVLYKLLQKKLKDALVLS